MDTSVKQPHKSPPAWEKNPDQVKSRPLAASILILGGILLIIIGMVVSICVGAAKVPLMVVLDTIFRYDSNNLQHQVVVNLRLPRSVTGALVGAAFSTAGAIMQGITRNPLADSGLLGINAGTGLVVVLVFAFFPDMSFEHLIYFSFLGAGLGIALIYAVAYFAKGRFTPLRLALSGVVIGSILKGISQAVSLLTGASYDLAFWSAGGISAVEWMQVRIMAPWLLLGLAGSIALSPKLTILSLGEDVAIGLGQRTKWIKTLSALCVLIMVGAAVATVGGIGFVGLIIPHIVRYLVGVDYRLIIPCSAILGSLLVVLADIGAKLIAMPYEIPIGSIMAAVGVPFFLYLARTEKRSLT